MKCSRPLRWAIACLTVPIIFAGLYFAWSRLTMVHTYVGHGAATPEEALVGFVQAIDERDYPRLRELVINTYQTCTGMDLTALDISSRQQIDLFLADHKDRDPKSMCNLHSPLYDGYDGHEKYARFVELWEQRGKHFRDSMIHYVPIIPKFAPKAVGDQRRIRFEYPLLLINEEEKTEELMTDESNYLDLIKRKNRWYIYNFTCHAMGIRYSGSPGPEPTPDL